MATKTYQVESPIRHDGKEYAVGAQIDLDDKDAKDLLTVNAIGAAAADNTPTAPADEAERIAAIVDAIGKLDAADASLWMKNQAPKTEAIAAITGWPVVAADRNAAWEQINAAK